MNSQHDPGSALQWEEEHSDLFIELGRVYTPGREEIARAVVDLLPAEPDEEFPAVEIGCGAGWLSEAVLRAFPRARVLALDGSEAMLRAAGELLAPYAGRVELRPFRLEQDAWLEGLRGVRAFCSSLVIHHLDGPGKRALYRRLHDALAPGGALLIADVVEPAGERERRYQAARWDAAVRERSIAFTGDERACQRFLDDHWNLWRYPDPDFDKPSTVAEHLAWLAEAGFAEVGVFWALAGHAVYGGRRPE